MESNHPGPVGPSPTPDLYVVRSGSAVFHQHGLEPFPAAAAFKGGACPAFAKARERVSLESMLGSLSSPEPRFACRYCTFGPLAQYLLETGKRTRTVILDTWPVDTEGRSFEIASAAAARESVKELARRFTWPAVVSSDERVAVLAEVTGEALVLLRIAMIAWVVPESVNLNETGVSVAATLLRDRLLSGQLELDQSGVTRNTAYVEDAVGVAALI